MNPGTIALLLAVLLLAGCAGSPGVIEGTRSAPMERQVGPAARDARAPRLSAVDNLLQRARRQHDEGQYEAAIATAERALRIERANAEIYLVIGSSYMALMDNRLASQFARQGLAFAAAGSRTRLLLRQLLAEAES